MRSIVKVQLRNMLHSKNFFFALLFVLGFSFVFIARNIWTFRHEDIVVLAPAWAYAYPHGFVALPQVSFRTFGNSEEFILAIGIFESFFLPLISCLAFSSSYYEDCKRGVMNSLMTRTTRKCYFISAGLVVFFSAFLLVILPYVLQRLVLLILCQGAPQQNMLFSTTDDFYSYQVWNEYWAVPTFLMPLQMNHPYLLNILYTMVPGLMGGAFGLLNFAVSLYFHRNRFMVLTFLFAVLWIGLPYLYVFLQPLGVRYWWDWSQLLSAKVAFHFKLIGFFGLMIPACLLIWYRVRSKRDVLL